jgi:HPt (histidine-containing phosphotransfer) domain-containing protein
MREVPMSQPSKPRASEEGAGRARSAGPLRSEFADDPEMSELVEQFVRELPSRLLALEAVWRAGDAQSLRRMAHQLKGAGSGYGFPGVSEAAADVESAIVSWGDGPAGVLEGVRGKVEALAAMCRRASGGRG